MFLWFWFRWVQNGLVQAQYWHDAHHLDQYIKHSLFLADINNERLPRNTSYAKNLAMLEKFVLVRFNNDSMVLPVASEWFEFYTPGQAVEILPLEESAIYKEVCYCKCCLYTPELLQHYLSNFFLRIGLDWSGLQWVDVWCDWLLMGIICSLRRNGSFLTLSTSTWELRVKQRLLGKVLEQTNVCDVFYIFF